MATYDVPDLDSWIADAVRGLPAAQVVPYPEWGAQTFQVAGKHFGRVSADPDGHPIVTVKGDPDDNAALVHQYEGFTPGYYANKRWWISLRLDDPYIPRSLCVEAIQGGYWAVRESLPKYVQAELDSSAQ
ncbi:MmcQ/YjbR family DNA-binding protein [Demequina sp. B12]|uniref:MmcQ/YjbR family DNA-binding protein n=1 Tax=Demequina sp. B12 TaxID=2992757 RepID=UPI00237BEFBA|nr:MmcQ/YjbR family DNA-binding protein [Demequina sp. B12]MDE0573857.1 MmcQ/YjbR family DNA-binding protein [Demequina sp. B12]